MKLDEITKDMSIGMAEKKTKGVSPWYSNIKKSEKRIGTSKGE